MAHFSYFILQNTFKKSYILQAALKNAKDTKDGVNKEITSLRVEVEVNKHFSILSSYFMLELLFLEKYFSDGASYACLPIFSLIQNAKAEAEAAASQLQGAESEVKALRSMTQRMVLTQKEMVCNINAAGLNFEFLGSLSFKFRCFRKKLFLRGVGLLVIGVWLQNMVSYVFDFLHSLFFSFGAV